MVVKTSERLQVLQDEIIRLAKMYRTAYFALKASGRSSELLKDLTIKDFSDKKWPRAEQIIGSHTPKFHEIAERYLAAIRPHAATVAQIREYVEFWSRDFAQSTSSKSLEILKSRGKIVEVSHGAYRSAIHFPGKLPVGIVKGIKPEINGPGLREEMRLLIIRFGPIETDVAIRILNSHYSIGGDSETDNFYTKIGKQSSVRYWTGVGWIHLDLAYLEPRILDELHFRHEGSKKLANRGRHVKAEREKLFAEIVRRAPLADDKSASDED